MTEEFNDLGSLYTLENQQWKKVGSGSLILMTLPLNPEYILIKVIDKHNKNSDDTGTVFQCKPKTKNKGNKSYILKGTDPKTKKEYILAARFKSEDTATTFRIALESAAELVPPKPPNSSDKKPSRPKSQTLTEPQNPHHQKRSSMNPEEMRKQFTSSQKAWDCRLCTSHNKAEEMFCPTCGTERLSLMLAKSPSLSSEHSYSNSGQVTYTKSPSLLPIGPDVNLDAATFYGDPSKAPYSPGISPMSGNSKSFDWGSLDANSQLKTEPSPEGGDVDSTKKDFIRILTNIESNMTHQDPLKLFDDLSKVAKRLMRKDPKYRTLDLKNPVVQERLLKIEGVDAYLKYLGFEEAANSKLICPDDQPPRSVIKAAQEVCKEMLNEWKKKQNIIGLLNEESKKDNDKNKDNNDDDDKKEDEAKKQDGEQYTLRQLVWSITHESSRDEKSTSDVILLCHSTFAESKHLLELLIERFHGKTTFFEKDKSPKNGVKDSLWHIQVKVGSMLSSWMKTFWEQDFEAKPGLMEDLDVFFDSIATEFSGDKRVQVLLKKMRGIYDMQYDKYSEETVEKKKIKHKDPLDLMGKPKDFSIIDQKAVRLAEQFTLMHFRAFKAIQKRECLGQSWKKKDGSAKNVLEMINLFNQTAKWVQILILTQPNLSKRAKVMKLCISIATYMKNFRNFNGSCAFHSALTSTPIHRLKIAWSKLSGADMKKYRELQKIFGYAGDNWQLLRKLHRQAHAPAILHTGLFLADLVGIDEGQQSHLKNGKVNFKKLLKLHEKIDTIAMYQQEEYQFKNDKFLQSVIVEDFKAQHQIDSDFLFKISSAVKAADSKKK